MNEIEKIQSAIDHMHDKIAEQNKRLDNLNLKIDIALHRLADIRNFIQELEL